MSENDEAMKGMQEEAARQAAWRTAAANSSFDQFMSDEQFNALLHDVIGILRKARGEESYIPTLAVALLTEREESEGDEDKPDFDIIMMPDIDMPRSDRWLGLLGMKYQGDGKCPIAVFWTSEAWMGGPRAREAWESGKAMRPSEDPDRVEVLVAAGMTIDRRANMATLPFQRDEEGKIGRFGDGIVMPYERDSPDKVAISRQATAFWDGYMVASALKRGIDIGERGKEYLAWLLEK